MKRFFAFVFALSFVLALSAQSSPVGVWKTIDDETGEAKSHVEIYEKDGVLHGKVVKLLQKSPDTLCELSLSLNLHLYPFHTCNLSPRFRILRQKDKIWQP